MSEWISVKDRLPKDGFFVDVWMKSKENKEYGQRKIDILYDKCNNCKRNQTSYFHITGLLDFMYVSHWMVSTPPKEKL